MTTFQSLQPGPRAVGIDGGLALVVVGLAKVFSSKRVMIISGGPVTDPAVHRAVINMLKRETMPTAEAQ